MASKKPYSELSRSGKFNRLKKLKPVHHDQAPEENLNHLVSFSMPIHQDSVDRPNENNIGIPINYSCDTVEQCSNDSNPNPFQINNSDIWDMGQGSMTESEDGSEDEESIWGDVLKNQKIQDDIRNWAIKFNITNVALSALLLILRVNNIVDRSLPIDARTLLKTPVAVKTREVPPGIYYHIGFQQNLERIWSKVSESVSNLEFLVGIDGLPLFRSCRGEFWPILVSVLNVPSIAANVFPVGIYYGTKKPSSCKLFLESFLREIKSLLEEGIFINGKKMLVSLKGFCCDAPAKSFILGIKGHTGYSSCTKCKQEGVYTNNRIVFPDIPDQQAMQSLLRTSEGFLRQEDDNHHNRESPLVSIPNLDFISGFPLDYMHLVCLGVMRSLLYLWIFVVPHKLPQRLVDIISTRLINLQPSIPVEFCRKPRRLDDIKRWKATEFRQFLLYTGPIVLKDVLFPQHYLNFLDLHVAMRILTNPKHCEIHKTYAQDLLIHFLQTFKDLYGKTYLTHNFHGLLHLADSVTTFGSLDRCSAFQFENYLHSMKKLIRKGNKPLHQIVRRLHEQAQCSTTPSVQTNYPFCSLPDLTLSSNNFKKLHFKDFILSNSFPNSCCKLRDGTIVIIKNIKQSESSIPIVTCKAFSNRNDFFSDPLCQSSAIGIHTVFNLLQTDQEVSAAEIIEKMVMLPLVGTTEGLLVLPLLHSE